MDTITADLSQLLKGGASIIGTADLTSITRPNQALSYALSIGVALPPQAVKAITDGPINEYIQAYHSVNRLLFELATIATKILRKKDYPAEIIEPTLDLVMADRMYASFPHKTAATAAGLGWVGKSALLVTKEYGSAIRFVTVFTSAPLPPGTPITDSLCGSCIECQRSCPAGAPSGKTWHAGLPRDEFWDSAACFRYCEEMKQNHHLSSQVCGKCIAVCPWTKKYISRSGLL